MMRIQIKKTVALVMAAIVLLCGVTGLSGIDATVSVAAAKYTKEKTVQIGVNGKAKVKLNSLLKKGDKLKSTYFQYGTFISDAFSNTSLLLSHQNNKLVFSQESYKDKREYLFTTDHVDYEFYTKKGGTIKIHVKLHLNEKQKNYLNNPDVFCLGGDSYDSSKANGLLPKLSYNLNNMGYDGNYGLPRQSHLSKNNDIFTRVEHLEDKVLIEQYNSSYQMISQKEIDLSKPMNDGTEAPLQGPVYGGVYNGERYNYLFLGQPNPNEDKNAEVIRIIKYDKDWNPIRSTSIYGSNTYIPFEAGSLDCAESGDMLYVHTCHQMFKSSDGKNHQANMQICYDQANDTVKKVHCGVSFGYGYSSHSFNQFIRVSGNDVFTIDHGDAYPRGIYLVRYKNEAGSVTTDNYYKRVLVEFPGGVGDNNTHARIGGFEISDSKCLIVYDDMENGGERFKLITVDKNSIVKGEVKIQELNATIYSDTSIPRICKLNSDRFVIYWTSKRTDEGSNGLFSMEYLVVDGNGETVVPLKSIDARLGDCVPVVDSGKMYWYHTGLDNAIYGNRRMRVANYMSDYYFEKMLLSKEWENYDESDYEYGKTPPVFYQLDPMTGELKKEMAPVLGQLKEPSLLEFDAQKGYVSMGADEGDQVHLFYEGTEYMATADQHEKYDKAVTCTSAWIARIKVPSDVVQKLYERTYEAEDAMFLVWSTKEGYYHSPRYTIGVFG